MNKHDTAIGIGDSINITACALILLLNRFGEDLVQRIMDEELTDTNDIMAVAKDTVVDYFNEHKDFS